MFLNELKIGETAQITDLSQVQVLLQKRLAHLGISEACEVCLKNKLPFGGPCVIDCKGQAVSLRKKDICTIQVEKSCR